MRTPAGGALLVALLWSASGAAQPLPPGEQTRAYAYGVGRISWTIPKDLQVILGVPHWSAGARLLCTGERYSCEIQVGPRDIKVSDEERLGQLEAAMRPALQPGSDMTFKPQRHGADQSVVYVMLPDAKGEPRYRAMGYTQRGPSVIRFEASADDAAQLKVILDLVDSAKAIDVLEMWAYRFADYKTVCAERFPGYRADNETAYAASPFAKADVVRFFMEHSSARTEEGVRKLLDGATQSYAKQFDGTPEDERRTFCEAFPRLIGKAAKDVPAK